MTTEQLTALKKLKALSKAWIKLQQEHNAALNKKQQEAIAKTEKKIKAVYFYAKEAVKKHTELVQNEEQESTLSTEKTNNEFDFSAEIELPEGFLHGLKQLEHNFGHLEQKFMAKVESAEDKKSGTLRDSQKSELLHKTDDLNSAITTLRTSYENSNESTTAACDTQLNPIAERLENLKARIIGTASYSSTGVVKALGTQTPIGESYGSGENRRKTDPNKDNSPVRKSNKSASAAVTTSFVFNKEKIAAAIGGGVTMSWTEDVTIPIPMAAGLLKATAGFGINFTANVEANTSANWKEERIGAEFTASLGLGGSLSIGLIAGELIEAKLTTKLVGSLAIKSKAYMDAVGNYEVMLGAFTGGIVADIEYSVGPSPVIMDILNLIDLGGVSLTYTNTIASAKLLTVGSKKQTWQKGFWALSEMDVSAGADLKKIVGFMKEQIGKITEIYDDFVNGIKNAVAAIGDFGEYCVKELNENVKEYSKNLKGFAVFLVTGEYQDAHEWREERMRMRKERQELHKAKCLELFNAVIDVAKQTALKNPKVLLELAKVDKDKRAQKLANICLNDAAVIAASDALFKDKSLRKGFLIGRALIANITEFDVIAEPTAGNSEIQVGKTFNALLVMDTDTPFNAPNISIELRCGSEVVGRSNYSGMISNSLNVQSSMEFNIPPNHPDSNTAKWTLYAKFNQVGDLQDREIEREIRVMPNADKGTGNENPEKFKDLTPAIGIHCPQVASYQGDLPLFAGLTLDIELTIDLPENIEDGILNVFLSKGNYTLAKGEMEGFLSAGKGIKRKLKLELPAEAAVKEQQIHGGEYTLGVSINDGTNVWDIVTTNNQKVHFYEGF